jgi:predicted ABC-class ATPase
MITPQISAPWSPHGANIDNAVRIARVAKARRQIARLCYGRLSAAQAKAREVGGAVIEAMPGRWYVRGDDMVTATNRLIALRWGRNCIITQEVACQWMAILP